jgi:flavin reductase (DIM6/NTAB) family NADH-FMN oxidoreductase RutF
MRVPSSVYLQNMPLDKAHRALAPRIAYIVTTIDRRGCTNAGVFSNVTSVSTEPERLVMSVYKQWDTIHNLRQVREFVVNVPSRQLVDAVWICGDKYAGNPIPRGVDELEIAGLTTVPAVKVGPPRVVECYAHLECVVSWIRDVGDHYLVLANIVAASCNEGVFNDDLTLDLKHNVPLMELARNEFTSPDGSISIDRAIISSRVDKALAKRGIKLSRELSVYKHSVISEE